MGTSGRDAEARCVRGCMGKSKATKMRAGLNEKHQPARLALLFEIASLRPPNQKRSDLFNPFSISLFRPARRLRARLSAARDCCYVFNVVIAPFAGPLC